MLREIRAPNHEGPFNVTRAVTNAVSSRATPAPGRTRMWVSQPLVWVRRYSRRVPWLQVEGMLVLDPRIGTKQLRRGGYLSSELQAGEDQ